MLLASGYSYVNQLPLFSVADTGIRCQFDPAATVESSTLNTQSHSTSCGMSIILLCPFDLPLVQQYQYVPNSNGIIDTSIQLKWFLLFGSVWVRLVSTAALPADDGNVTTE